VLAGQLALIDLKRAENFSSMISSTYDNETPKLNNNRTVVIANEKKTEAWVR